MPSCSCLELSGDKWRVDRNSQRKIEEWRMTVTRLVIVRPALCKSDAEQNSAQLAHVCDSQGPPPLRVEEVETHLQFLVHRACMTTIETETSGTVSVTHMCARVSANVRSCALAAEGGVCHTR